MLQALVFIIQSVADILAGALLLRFIMQWMRVPFYNQIGQFVIAMTDWCVRPTRKLIPGLWGMDVASLFLAWLVQGMGAALVMGLSGHLLETSPHAVALVAVVAVFELLKLALHLLFGVVILMAIISWVNPYAPIAPVLNAIARPFLAPFQRIIPPIGGVDLSPIALMLVLQLLMAPLDGLRFHLIQLFLF